MVNGTTLKKKDELEEEKKWMEEYLTKNTREWILKNLTSKEVKLLVESIKNEDDKKIQSNNKLKWLYDCLTQQQNINKEGKHFLTKEDIKSYRAIEAGKVSKMVFKDEEGSVIKVKKPKEIVFEEKEGLVIKGRREDLRYPPTVIISKPMKSEEELTELIKQLEKEEKLVKQSKKEKIIEQSKKEKVIEQLEKEKVIDLHAYKHFVRGLFKKDNRTYFFTLLSKERLTEEQISELLSNPESKLWKEDYITLQTIRYEVVEGGKIQREIFRGKSEENISIIIDLIKENGGFEKCLENGKIQIFDQKSYEEYLKKIFNK